MTDLERAKNCIIFVIGVLDSLRRAGFVSGDCKRLLVKGEVAFSQLDAEGFRLSRDEAVFVIGELTGITDEASMDAILEFVLRWDDAKVKLEQLGAYP